MTQDNLNILECLETLAAACPWDAVDIWIKREPEGKLSFTAYINANEKLGMSYSFGYGATPSEAVQNVLAHCGTRDPEASRQAKIAELREQIAKLQQVTIGLPPYKPNRELAAANIPHNQTVDVEGIAV